MKSSAEISQRLPSEPVLFSAAFPICRPSDVPAEDVLVLCRLDCGGAGWEVGSSRTLGRGHLGFSLK